MNGKQDVRRIPKFFQRRKPAPIQSIMTLSLSFSAIPRSLLRIIAEMFGGRPNLRLALTYGETRAAQRLRPSFQDRRIHLSSDSFSVTARLRLPRLHSRHRQAGENVSPAPSIFFADLFLRLFNIEVSTVNLPPPGKNHLIVVNHLGFLDDFIVAGMMPAMFITSVEPPQDSGDRLGY